MRLPCCCSRPGSALAAVLPWPEPGILLPAACRPCRQAPGRSLGCARPQRRPAAVRAHRACLWCRQRAWERQLRRGLIWAAFVALTVFYAIPVGAIQALVEVDRLQNVPGFKQLLQITFIKALLQSVFPSAPRRPSPCLGLRAGPAGQPLHVLQGRRCHLTRGRAAGTPCLLRLPERGLGVQVWSCASSC